MFLGVELGVELVALLFARSGFRITRSSTRLSFHSIRKYPRSGNNLATLLLTVPLFFAILGTSQGKRGMLWKYPQGVWREP